MNVTFPSACPLTRSIFMKLFITFFCLSFPLLSFANTCEESELNNSESCELVLVNETADVCVLEEPSQENNSSDSLEVSTLDEPEKTCESCLDACTSENSEVSTLDQSATSPESCQLLAKAFVDLKNKEVESALDLFINIFQKASSEDSSDRLAVLFNSGLGYMLCMDRLDRLNEVHQLLGKQFFDFVYFISQQNEDFSLETYLKEMLSTVKINEEEFLKDFLKIHTESDYAILSVLKKINDVHLKNFVTKILEQ